MRGRKVGEQRTDLRPEACCARPRAPLVVLVDVKPACGEVLAEQRDRSFALGITDPEVGSLPTLFHTFILEAVLGLGVRVFDRRPTRRLPTWGHPTTLRYVGTPHDLPTTPGGHVLALASSSYLCHARANAPRHPRGTPELVTLAWLGTQDRALPAQKDVQGQALGL